MITVRPKPNPLQLHMYRGFLVGPSHENTAQPKTKAADETKVLGKHLKADFDRDNVAEEGVVMNDG